MALPEPQPTLFGRRGASPLVYLDFDSSCKNIAANSSRTRFVKPSEPHQYGCSALPS
jgi:hypothetical protein